MNLLTLELPPVESIRYPKLNTVATFIKNTTVFAKNKIVEFVKGFYNHIESIGILVLSSFGVSALIGELPFFLTLPWWIETAMVIPVLSVFIIWGLVTINEKRTKKRLSRA